MGDGARCLTGLGGCRAIEAGSIIFAKATIFICQQPSAAGTAAEPPGFLEQPQAYALAASRATAPSRPSTSGRGRAKRRPGTLLTRGSSGFLRY
jgi:hypothetical protein